MTPKLTLNLGLRWDMFVPWVEEDDRQSNYDPSTGCFVVASDDAVINGVQVGRYLQTYSKERLRSAPRLRLRPAAATAGPLIRGGFGIFWNWGVGRNVLVEGARTRRSSRRPTLRPARAATNLRLPRRAARRRRR